MAKKHMSNYDGINEIIKKLAEDGVELDITHRLKVEFSIGEQSEISTFIEGLPNLDGLTHDQLEDLLATCEERYDELQAEEPEDEDAYDEWEEQCSDLEDLIEDIEDLLE